MGAGGGGDDDLPLGRGQEVDHPLLGLRALLAGEVNGALHAAQLGGRNEEGGNIVNAERTPVANAVVSRKRNSICRKCLAAHLFLQTLREPCVLLEHDTTWKGASLDRHRTSIYTIDG